MQMSMFAVHDSKAAAFLTPFFSPTRATAIRAFRSACLDSNHDFHRYAADYTLFELGEFDDQDGVISTHESPQSIGLALVFLSEAESLETLNTKLGLAPAEKTA